MDMSAYHHLTFFLTVVYLEDEKTGDVTAFYAQFPEATSQGKDKEEAKMLLNEIFPLMMEDKQQELIDLIQRNPGSLMTYEQQTIIA